MARTDFHIEHQQISRLDNALRRVPRDSIQETAAPVLRAAFYLGIGMIALAVALFAGFAIEKAWSNNNAMLIERAAGTLRD